MTLSAATAVAFAVSGGSPTDAREWITVDLAGQPSTYRRGFVVMTESLDPTGRGEDMARQTRALLMHELRRHQKQPADAALARAFAVANSYVHEEGRFRGGVGQEFKIGATAVVFEGHVATIAHVPPGQLVLAQDGLVYAIPELGSWLPHYVAPEDDAPTPEPLGHASWTAPLLVQTELREGDTLVFSTAPVGRALAGAAASGTHDNLTLTRFHGRDPERIMDALRDLVIDEDLPAAAVAVVGFPPPERGSGIENFADIRRNARDQWRHAQAAVRQFVPRRRAKPKAFSAEAIANAPPVPAVLPADAATTPAQATRRKREQSLQERLIRLTERRSTSWRDTWRQPAEQHRLGAPGAHGLSRYREVSLDSSEPRWTHALPRLPFLTGPMFIGLIALLVLATGTLAYLERDRFLPSEEDYMQYVVELDQRLLAMQDLEDEDAIRAELNRAEDDLAAARAAGAPSNVLRPLEQQLTLERDEIENVIRLDDLTRIGSLPPELQDGETQAIQTQGGVFLANGSLYRLRPEAREMIIVLETGTQVEGKTVGDLFGVAYDGQTLIVTDGTHVFFAGSADGSAWQAITMEEVNEQGAWPRGPIDAFAENLYLLVNEYRNVYQFVLDGELASSPPIDWVLTGDRVNFNMAVDMTIDGNIYVLLEDGRVLTMRRGAQIAEFEIPTFDAENEQPLAIIGGPMTGYLYVAVVDDEGHGRVIAMDREGGHMSQLTLPDGFTTGNAEVLPPFDELQDIGVDEASGTLYLINGDGVWTVRYSLPPLPAPEGTPEASPAPAA
jgi:hypothetical protein